MASTLLLDRASWDLAIDAQGNIAKATEPYSAVQDVASACRLFEAEYWYDVSIGVPYFQQILGHFQPIQVVKTALEAAALSVPEVTAATVLLDGIVGRQLTGQVQVQVNGVTSVVAI